MWDLAYDTTIHKAMGFEYETVIMPLFKAHTIRMYRNLLNTGITRAKKWVVTARLTESDKVLATESRVFREKEFIWLKKDRVIIYTAHLSGSLLVNVLMVDPMENMK